MIPKIINYCWFGRGEKTELFNKCIKSWQKFCPDYEIIEWNENNFDVYQNDFVALAYKEKKYGFVPDFARFFILYNHGGVYLDTDVEIIKNIDDLLKNKAFIGTEQKGHLINPGSGIGAEKGSKIILEFMEFYKDKKFENNDGVLNMTPSPCLLTPIIKNKGWKDNNLKQVIDGLTIYPTDFFCPKDYDGILRITDNTYSIHYFEGSWIDDDIKKISILQGKISKLFGVQIGLIIAYIIKVFKRKGFVFLIKRLPSMIKKYFTKF